MNILQTMQRILNSHRFKRLVQTISPASLRHNARRRLMGDRLIVVLGSAHRVGSTWLTHLLEDMLYFEYEFEYWRVPRACRTQTHSGHLLRTIELDRPETVDFLSSARGYRIFKTHSPLDWESIPPHIAPLSIYRDPRDVIVSTVFYLTSAGEDAGGFPDHVKALPLEERLARVIEDNYNLSLLEHWFYHDHVHSVRYEDLKRDAPSVLRNIADYLEVDVEDERIREVVDWHAFKNRAGRKAGQENQSSHLRKGVSGDWKNHFDAQSQRRFKQANEGRWNRLLVDMGYESTLDW